MTARAPKLALYAAFAAASFLTALVLGRPELAALGAPFAFVLVVGLSLPPPARVEASLRPRAERALEGDVVDADLVVSAGEEVPALRLALELPDGIALAGGADSCVLHLDAGEERTLPIRLRCDHWGAHRPGRLFLRASDRARLRVVDAAVPPAALLRVYPRAEWLESLMAPHETQPFAGNRVARAKGEGIEFADVRPYVRGDRARRINWRASALRQTLFVNEQHPERNSDVVLFLDSFAEARRLEESTIDLALRAASSLANGYLADRDRVGLVTFGGVVRWLAPATGTTQRYRIVDALLETQVTLSYAWKDIDVLPARSLTPHALVIALSPLLDARTVDALLDLRARGFDLVVVDLSPLVFGAEERDPRTRLALRLWRLWREELRFRYERLGVAVVEWDGEQSLAAAVEEVRAFRRFARVASG